MDKVWNGAGKPLGEDIRRLGREELIALALEVCEDAAACGAPYHGNIHPGNIRRGEDGAVLGPRADHAPGDWSTDELEYMAPELFWNGTADASADVYSIGLLLYAGVTGGLMTRRPFRAPHHTASQVAVIGGADGPTAIYIAEKADGRPGLNPGIPAEDAAADRDEETANLAQRLTASGDFTHASALAFLVFILLYFPCIATVAAIGSEAGWRWAVASVAYNTLLAWLAAWAVYHLVMWL